MYRITQSGSQVVVQQSQPLMPAISVGALLVGVVITLSTAPSGALVLGPGIVCLIVLPLFLMQTATYTFDRHLRRLTYSRRGPMFRKSGGTLNYSEIKSIDYESHDKPGFGYRVVITTDSGKIPMSNTYSFKLALRECYEHVYGAVFDSSIVDSSVGAIKSDGKSLKSNNFEDTDDLRANVRILLDKKQNIEAIKLVRKETGMDLRLLKSGAIVRVKKGLFGPESRQAPLC